MKKYKFELGFLLIALGFLITIKAILRDSSSWVDWRLMFGLVSFFWGTELIKSAVVSMVKKEIESSKIR